MSSNLFAQFRRLLGAPPLQIGEVIATSGDTATIELPDGGKLQARGAATVGDQVYVRGGLIEAQAPSLPVDVIDL